MELMVRHSNTVADFFCWLHGLASRFVGTPAPEPFSLGQSGPARQGPVTMPTNPSQVATAFALGQPLPLKWYIEQAKRRADKTLRVRASCNQEFLEELRRNSDREGVTLVIEHPVVVKLLVVLRALLMRAFCDFPVSPIQASAPCWTIANRVAPFPPFASSLPRRN